MSESTSTWDFILSTIGSKQLSEFGFTFNCRLSTDSNSSGSPVDNAKEGVPKAEDGG
jgi:hypothetical protein